MTSSINTILIILVRDCRQLLFQNNLFVYFQSTSRQKLLKNIEIL